MELIIWFLKVIIITLGHLHLAVSLFISDKSDNVIQTLFEKLSSNGGQIMVPLDNYEGEGDYGFGKKFGWCEDKYGISWQLMLSE